MSLQYPILSCFLYSVLWFFVRKYFIRISRDFDNLKVEKMLRTCFFNILHFCFSLFCSLFYFTIIYFLPKKLRASCLKELWKVFKGFRKAWGITFHSKYYMFKSKAIDQRKKKHKGRLIIILLLPFFQNYTLSYSIFLHSSVLLSFFI